MKTEETCWSCLSFLTELSFFMGLVKGWAPVFHNGGASLYEITLCARLYISNVIPGHTSNISWLLEQLKDLHKVMDKLSILIVGIVS
jgi:hypothetical protein